MRIASSEVGPNPQTLGSPLRGNDATIHGIDAIARSRNGSVNCISLQTRGATIDMFPLILPMCRAWFETDPVLVGEHEVRIIVFLSAQIAVA